MSDPRDTLPSHARLTELAIWSHHRARLVRAAISLEVADHVGDGKLSAESLAERIGARPASLYRFMRALCSLGLFHLDEEKQFSLTELGAALQKRAPGGFRAAIHMLYIEPSNRAWDNLEHAIVTGKTAFETANGESFFDYLGKHPELAAAFSETMVNLSNAEPPAVAEAFDYSRFNTIVDVGGATGYLLCAILDRHAGPGAVLCDLPHVLKDAPALLQARGLQERVKLQPGNFFESVPAGGDLYILSHIIHDWADEEALIILRNCRAAMRDDAVLHLVEMVIGDVNQPAMGPLIDMSMLVFGSGKERTQEEYGHLLQKGGFNLQGVVPTASNASIIEARPI